LGLAYLPTVRDMADKRTPINPSPQADDGIVEIQFRLGCTKTAALDFAVAAGLKLSVGEQAETHDQRMARLLGSTDG
jgi:hypothetical protein